MARYTTDVTTLISIMDWLKQTFHVGEVCIVADLGMTSAKTMDELEAHGSSYILGVRMRSSKEAQAIDAGDEGHYRTVFRRRRTAKDPSPLRVKEIWLVGINEDPRGRLDAELRDHLCEPAAPRCSA